MNHANYDRLVQHLGTVDPKTFDYATSSMLKSPDAGCLACHCKALTAGASKPMPAAMSVIKKFLDVTINEAAFLYGVGTRIKNGPIFVEAEDNFDAIKDLAGPMGIDEALRRLAIVAERYPREVVPDDAAFLAQCRAVVSTVPVELARECDARFIADNTGLFARKLVRKVNGR